MSQVDYYGIQQAIQAQLNNSLTTQNVSVNIEPIDDPDGTVPWIGIYLEEAPREVAFIGGTNPHIVTPTFIIECFEFDINEFVNACQKRDNFLKEVEEVLLLDRTLQGTVTISEITKVGFEIGRIDDGFFVGGEIFFETQLRG